MRSFDLKRYQYVVKIEKVKEGRSINQNSYLHLIFGIIEKETGQPADEVKIYYKQRFLMEEKEIFGELIKEAKSTAGLSKDEFSGFVTQVRHNALHELNIYLPEPNEFID